jgi:LuxR family transcriptional regulator, maltose regulon positive regulatory protein
MLHKELASLGLSRDVSAPTGSRGLVSRPRLFEVLDRAMAGRVTVVSAPPGSGKTVLLRSWLDQAGLARRVAWVSVERGEDDEHRFWVAVARALGSALTPSAEPGVRAVIECLLSALDCIRQPVVLVIDDLHELRSADALAQLGLLLSRLPPLLHVVLATRRDPQLGLGRLRVAGELTEIRDADLRFTLAEARELLAVAGIVLAEADLAVLHDKTEGWAAGLRMAAMALAAHPEPGRFVAEFSGTERTVADYLLTEALDHQPKDVRALLLRTSMTERVSGPLADFLTGGSGSERMLQTLEDENAFVVSLDAGRCWFRYHHLFADLLRLELRRHYPELVTRLCQSAAQWHAQHGYLAASRDEPADAVFNWPGPPATADALSRAELRVLKYLPSNLSGSEISAELFVSRNTVGTHIRHIYAKLGVHRRSEAVCRARQLGLLASSARPS